MASRWLGAGLLLALVSLLVSLFIGLPKIDSMQTDIREALNAEGYQNINVEMNGNVATLSGQAASEAAKANALDVAENTECSACKNKRRWHEVKDDMTFQSVPDQSPYTFRAVKDASGVVTVSGFVPSETAKADIILAGNRIFNTKVIDRTIRVAPGEPDAQFTKVTEGYMTQLAKLDRGSFEQEDYNGLLRGTVGDAAVRDSVSAAGRGFSGEYGKLFRADITVPAATAPVINSVDECQVLFEEVKGNNRILFEVNAANIKGRESFDLLKKIAAAANRCPAFNVTIAGHTDSDGDAAYNQRLSEARAATVKNYLQQQQVEGDRLTATGFGETNPVATNATAAGKAQNRRITFTVTQGQ